MISLHLLHSLKKITKAEDKEYLSRLQTLHSLKRITQVENIEFICISLDPLQNLIYLTSL
jgi:hypothetical protein